MRSIRLKLLLFFRFRIKNTRMQRFLEKRIAALSGGYYYSSVIRDLYKELHGLEIGYGTYGGCWNNASLWWNNITIGRYCSFAGNIYIGGSHPLDIFTTHPITYDTWSGGANSNHTPPRSHSHTIEHGVYVGQGAIILEGCRNVGNGAVIGAGSVVTHDVPPYAIVAGNPAKILRYRLTPEQIEKVEASKWWELDKDELNERMKEFLELTNEK